MFTIVCAECFKYTCGSTNYHYEVITPNVCQKCGGPTEELRYGITSGNS